MTHHTIATQRATSTTAPSRPPPTRCARGAGRAIASEATFTSRVVVVVVLLVVRSSGFWVVHRRAKRRQAQWWEMNTPSTRAFFLCSVRGLPWALPPLPGTKRPDGRAGVAREVRHFAVLGRLWTTPGRGTNHGGAADTAACHRAPLVVTRGDRLIGAWPYGLAMVMFGDVSEVGETSSGRMTGCVCRCIGCGLARGASDELSFDG